MGVPGWKTQKFGSIGWRLLHCFFCFLKWQKFKHFKPTLTPKRPYLFPIVFRHCLKTSLTFCNSQKQKKRCKILHPIGSACIFVPGSLYCLIVLVCSLLDNFVQFFSLIFFYIFSFILLCSFFLIYYIRTIIYLFSRLNIRHQHEPLIKKTH